MRKLMGNKKTICKRLIKIGLFSLRDNEIDHDKYAMQT